MRHEKLTEKHPVQFGKTMWELLTVAAGRASIKKKEPITPAKYVRNVMARHLNRLKIKGE